jgi:hypothetical protein
MKPPQQSAKKHQATIQGPYSASKTRILEQSAASYQFALFWEVVLTASPLY